MFQRIDERSESHQAYMTSIPFVCGVDFFPMQKAENIQEKQNWSCCFKCNWSFVGSCIFQNSLSPSPRNLPTGQPLWQAVQGFSYSMNDLLNE